MCTLMAENSQNLNIYWIIEIFLVLHNIHIAPRNQDKVVFYVNNCIDWYQFNQLYDYDWMKKSVQNVDMIVCKLRLVLIKAISLRLEVAQEEKQEEKR